jgi:probable phosphoglycerate mutase
LTAEGIRQAEALGRRLRDVPFELPAQVAERADRVLDRVLPVPGRVLVVSHGHTSRVLAARFLGLPGEAGALFALGVASISMLGYEHDRPVIMFWNQSHSSRDGVSQ